MSEIKSKLRKLRLIQFALIAVVLIFGWLAEIDRGRGNSDWTLQRWLVTGLTLWAVLGGLRIRHRLLRRAGQALTTDASDPKALRQWEAGQVVGLAVAESVAVWGLLVRMVLGGALWQALSFYVVALFLLLLWTPRMPTIASSN